MRLRIRSLETKETLRIEIPNNCSLQQLRHLISQRIPSTPPPHSIRLSLNRSDEIVSSSPEASVESIGFISGDLIYFTLNRDGFSPEPSVGPSLSQIVREPPHQNHQGHVPNLENQGDTQNLDVVEGKPPDSETQEGITSGSGELLVEAPNSSTQRGEPSYSGSLATEQARLSMEVHDEESVHEIGKSFSVPGFLRKVFTKELGDDSGRDHKLLVLAVHAVLLDSGFVAFDPCSKTLADRLYLLGEWPRLSFSMLVFYTLPDFFSDGLLQFGEFQTVKLRFESLGRFLNVYGTLVNGNSKNHWARLDEDRLVPFLNVVWANCGLGDKYQRGGNGNLPEREVFEFWRRVKDDLALPLLIDLCEKAGFGLPPCFMRLPTDLKLKILESLGGVEIAKLACICSELRYLASSEELWKQKFGEQFGHENEFGDEKLSWRERFVRAWEAQKRRNKIGRVIHPRDYPRLGFPPHYPFPYQHPFPSPYPFILGGEHDLNPNLGLFGEFIRHGVHSGASRRNRNSVPPCNLGGNV